MSRTENRAEFALQAEVKRFDPPSLWRQRLPQPLPCLNREFNEVGQRFLFTTVRFRVPCAYASAAREANQEDRLIARRACGALGRRSFAAVS